MLAIWLQSVPVYMDLGLDSHTKTNSSRRPVSLRIEGMTWIEYFSFELLFPEIKRGIIVSYQNTLIFVQTEGKLIFQHGDQIYSIKIGQTAQYG